MLNSHAISPLLRKGYPVALCIALLFAGCDSVDAPSPSSLQAVEQSHSVPASEAITFAEGRLVFPSQEEFDAFMDALIEEPSHEDLEITGLDPGFVSLETMQDMWEQDAEEAAEIDEMAESVSDQDVDDLPEEWQIVEDPLFARVLNHDGQIQIGDTVYKVTYDNVYATAYGADDVLDEIPLKARGSTPSFKDGSSVDIYPVIRYKTDIFSDAVGKDQGIMGEGDCKATFKNNHRRRIKGEIWANYWTFYNPVGSEIEAQRRRFRRWKQTRMSWISMKITRYLKYEEEISNGSSASGVYINKEPVNFYHSKTEAREIRANHSNSIRWTEIGLSGYFQGIFDGEMKTCSSFFFKTNPFFPLCC